jgi:hypothetical protein
MSDDDELEDDELGPWSRHGPDAALAEIAAAFQELIVFGWNAAARLKRRDRLQDLVDLHREALMCGVNDEDVRRAWAIVQDMAEAAGGVDNLAPRRRGRPRKPVKPKPAREPSARDREIYADIKRRRLELMAAAIENKDELDPTRLRKIFRAARRGAIHAAEVKGVLDLGRDPSTDRKRIDRLRKYDIEQLQKSLVDALLGAPKQQERDTEPRK